jgi:molecular chaperone HtpG
LLRKVIANRNDSIDATTAMSVITLNDPPEEEEENAHYFRVTLENVSSDSLLELEYVTNYLSMVAPVPFTSTFTFAEEIKAYLTSRNLVLDEYNIEVNGISLFKKYKDTFSDSKEGSSNLIGVDFVDIRNEEQELIATCWYGFRDHSNLVLEESNIERGIRMRTKNISIGDESTCSRFFDQERTTLRFIGEIHTLSKGFTPNARRDYFTENPTSTQFEKNARAIFNAENLENRLAHTASKLHNRLAEILDYKEQYDNFFLKKGTFDGSAAETYQLNRLKELEIRALKAKSIVEKIHKKAGKSWPIDKLYKSIIGDHDLSMNLVSGTEFIPIKQSPPVFSKLSDAERSVVLEIFDIIEDELEFEISQIVKRRIIERFN